MKLSILIVNYNGKDYLDDCLRSIRRHVKVDHEVIIVDNASTDGSCDYLRAFSPDVKLIVSEKNLGFAGGNNIGAREARGEYLLLLNNDTVLLNDINPAIEQLERHHDIGNVGAMMLNGNNQYSLSAGYFPSPLRLIRMSSIYKKNEYFKNGNFPQSRIDWGYKVDWVAGSFLLTRLSLWHRLNGLDEGYFMYGEDVDYCRRTHDAGFVTSYCPDVRYIHYCGFGPSRLPMVTIGFKRYHQKYSNLFLSTLASGILYSGLIARIFLYGALFSITRSPEYGAKTKACFTALKTF